MNAPGGKPLADVTVLTSRDDFLLELGQGLGGQAAVRPVDSLEAALASLGDTRRAQLLVIDARELTDVPAAADAVHAAAPQALVLVFAESGTRRQLRELLRRSSKVFAVLPIPIDAGKTQAVLGAAIANAVANRSAAPGATVAAAQTIGDLRPQRATAAPGAGGKRAAIMLAAVAIVATALAAGAYWYFARGSGATGPGALAGGPASPAAGVAGSGARNPGTLAAAAGPAAAAVNGAAAHGAAPNAAAAHDGAGNSAADNAPLAPAADTSILQGKVDELLEKARLAMHERRFAEPTGDNALLYYRSAIAADAGNAEARDGLQRVAGALAGRFEETLSSGHLDEAAVTLASFKVASPADSRSPAYEQRLYAAEISRALTDGNPDRATGYLRQAQQSGAVPADQLGRWRTDIARRQEEARVQRLAGLIADRIRDGALIGNEDSARSYLQQLQALAPANAATQRASRDLIGACLRNAREAALSRNTAEQNHWLDEARALGMQPGELASFERELAAARQKAAQADNERLAQLARERLRDGRLTDPPQDSAAFYLTQLQSSDPNGAALAEAGRELAQRLLERARSAAQAGAAADADLALARHWGADAKDVQAIQQLRAAPQSAATAPDPVTLAASLKRLRATPPDYPPNALQQRVTGSVMLHFIVDARGEPRDIHVLDATPRGVFEQAAIEAVKRWRYAPMLVNGAAVEVPVTTRVRFELPK